MGAEDKLRASSVPSPRVTRDASVCERWAKEHAADARLRRCRLAQTARSGSRVKHSAGHLLAPQLVLGVAYSLPFGVGIRVLVLDDPAWPLADECPVEYEYGSIRLIAPGLGETLHFGSGLVPPKFRLAKDGLGSGRRVPRTGDERHCACDKGSSAVQQTLGGHDGSQVTANVEVMAGA